MAVTRAHGICLLDKPQEWTSHDVVGRMRRVAATRKVGHAGTLDPMATGLLVAGIGQGTRLLTYLVGADKTYTATIRVGQATTTDDAEGEALGEAVDATGFSDERVASAVSALTGEIMQVPSAVSAIKVDGQRAYARVRAGEDVQLAARPITVHEFKVLTRREEGPFLDLDVEVSCSSGTYIRALARDLGQALDGSGAHLTALRRTQVGPFTVAQASPVPPRGEDDVTLPAMGLGETAAAVLTPVSVSEADARALTFGQKPEYTGPAGAETVAVLDAEGRLVSIAQVRAGKLAPKLVIPEEARS
ncbi:tRNA pseudouridine(55) synthase TruB [Dermabacteraceae bacterium P13103]